MLELTQINTGYEVSFAYKPWLVDAIKMIPGARWNPSRKNWFVPKESSSALLNWSKQIGGKVAAPARHVEIGEIEPLPELDIQIPLKRSLYYYQAQGVAYSLKHKKVIIGDEPGLGKAQPLHSLIATPNGFITMAEALTGMEVLGIDGKTYQIEAIYPQGIRKVYKITFNDGTSCECDIEHLWQVRDMNRRLRGLGWCVKSTQELLNQGLKYNLNEKRKLSNRKKCLKWELPIPKAFEGIEKDYVIHPYIMGALLGDGSICGKMICISIPDFEIETKFRIEKLLPKDLKMRLNPYTDCPQYYITQNISTKKNPFKKEIEELGVNVKGLEKFIPKKYLLGSKIQRLELLRGLMDTDGSSKKNRITFHTCSPKLANDISELVFSLGGQAIIREYNRIKEGKGIEWQVNIRLNECPFYIERKVQNWSLSKRNYASKYIESIDYVGEMETKCIKVSAPDSLYMTDHYIVTHNTFQSIATLVAANVKCILVICPATLKENWVNEWKMNAGWQAMEITDRIKTSWVQYYKVGMCKVFVVNYESLKKYFVESINKPEDKPLRLNHVKFRDTINLFDAVIIDELHRCKSSKTLQSKLAAGICRGKEYILGLTGTPIQNKPADLWPQLGIIQQIENFGGYKGFVDRYCDGPTQSSNLKELNYLLNKHCFYRRAKRDVLKDLPKMTRNIHKVSISNRNEYVKAENNFIEYLRENLQKTDGEIDTALRGQAMVLIGILKKISARGKIEQVLEHIQEVTDAGEKIVVFCWHKEIVDELKKHLPHAVTVVGSDPQEKRQQAVHDFQKCKKCNIRLENHKNLDHEYVASDTNVIICNIKSGGVGITLTASSRVIHLELPWTAADCEQDESRCDRISQRFPVESGYFLGANTIDEYIYELIDKKRNIANQVTGANEEVETNMVDEFINLFTKDKF